MKKALVDVYKRLIGATGTQDKSTINQLVYAIGDIHGSEKPLKKLLMLIDKDRGSEPAHLIFLGDYIDRGPDTPSVINELIKLRETSVENGLKVSFLRGNHEAVLLDFLHHAGAGPTWMKWGGTETLVSYGVCPPPGSSGPQDWEDTRAEFAAVLPAAHLDFFNSLQLSASIGDYLFVHAGIDPERPIDRQGEREFLWIRDEFLDSRKQADFVVVHGHTPTDEPHSDSRRIGIDTGAHATGKLTAVKLSGTERAFIQS